MESLGVDVFYAMPFDRSVMDMPPEDYVGHLVRQFHPTDVVCGYNHTFGKKGGGTPALLAALGDCLLYTSPAPWPWPQGRFRAEAGTRPAFPVRPFLRASPA